MSFIDEKLTGAAFKAARDAEMHSHRHTDHEDAMRMAMAGSTDGGEFYLRADIKDFYKKVDAAAMVIDGGRAYGKSAAMEKDPMLAGGPAMHTGFNHQDKEGRRIFPGSIVRYHSDVKTAFIFEVEKLAEDKDGCYPVKGSVVLQSTLLDDTSHWTIAQEFLELMYTNGCSCVCCTILEFPNGSPVWDTPLEREILSRYNKMAV